MTYRKFVSEVFAVVNNPNVADRAIARRVLAEQPDLYRVSWSNAQIIRLAAQVWKKYPASEKSTAPKSPKKGKKK